MNFPGAGSTARAPGSIFRLPTLENSIVLPRPLIRLFPAVLLSAAVTLASCSDGGSGPPPPPPPPAPGSFSLSVTATTPASISQGSSGTATVTVNRTGSFTGAVNLTVDGEPTGVTVVYNAAVASGSTTASLSIDVALSVPTGTYPLTIRGQASGQPDQTTTLQLVVVPRPASITLARATNVALSANAGGIPITFNVIISRTEFLGEVTLEAASGLPTGVTAAFAPSPTTGNTIGVTFTIAASTVPGNYTAELRGTGQGIQPATLSVPFTVLGVGSVTVSLSRPAMTIPQNGSDQGSIVLNRTNYNGPVTLAATNVPTGVTLGFGTNPLSTNGTAINLTVGPAAPAGNHSITITASAPGVTGSSAVLTLTITPTGSGGNTAVRFCGTPAEIPIWFGVQDGNNWTRVTIGAANTFTFDFPSQGSIAWVNQHGADDFRISIVTGTQAEIAVIAGQQCPSPSNRTVSGTVAGLTVTDLAQVAFGPRSPATAPTFAVPAFQITNLPDGPLDLLAARAPVGIGGFLANKLLIQRGQNPASGGSLGTLDFNGAGALTPDEKTITVSGAGVGEQLLLSSFFRTAGGTSLTLGAATIGAGTTGPIRHVPSGSIQAGDFHTLMAAATQTSGSNTSSRSTTLFAAQPAAATLTLGAVPADPAVLVFSSNPTWVRFMTNIPPQTDYQRLYIAGWYQTSGATRRDITMTVTEAMATVTVGSGGTNVRMRVPDFSLAPGWNQLWESRNGIPATWLTSASGWNAAGGLSAPIAEGTVTKSYTKTGTITP